MSNPVAVQQKRFIKLTPSNNSSNFGPTGSQPIIRFSIADTQALALLKDARLNFTFTADRTGSSGLPAIGDDFNIDQCLSLCSVMDQIIISSRRFGNTLEQVVNLGRLESSYYRSKFSPKMEASNMYNLNKAVGMGRYNRYSGTFARGGSLVTQTLNDVHNIAQRKSSLTQAVDCSIPFHAGTFLTDKPLDLNASGGLELAIYLSKAEQLFYGATGGTNPPTSASTYTLTNVSLTVPLLYKSADMINATPPEQVIEFLNWTSLYSVMDSTTSSISQRLYLNGLVSAIHNMLPTAQINSVASNQYALKNPVVQRLTFLRDGQRNPLEKTAIVQSNSNDTAENSSSTYPEVINDYMSAWGATKDQIYSQVMPENLKGVSNRSGVFGLGCNYSPDSAGINMNGVLGIDVQSRVRNVANNGTEPYALYSFYLARQAFLSTPMGMKAM